MSAGESDRLPKKCTRMNDEGQLPTCTQVGDGDWVVDYPDPLAPAGGMGLAIGMLFAIGVLVSLVVVAWKVSTARRLARSAGMDEGDAVRMALFTDDGIEATYLASSLRDRPAEPAQPAPEPVRGAAARLRELDELRQQGLITEEEHAERRRQILDSL